MGPGLQINSEVEETTIQYATISAVADEVSSIRVKE